MHYLTSFMPTETLVAFAASLEEAARAIRARLDASVEEAA